METAIQPGFRVIRGPDWAYKTQDGGKGHAGTVLSLQEVHQPCFPPKTVMVQWDSGDKGLYRAGYDQAFDLRIIDTANSVRHPKIWCDGCNVDEIRGIRWRCTECFAIDLCTTCYMNDEHDLSHVFMRVGSSEKTSMGPKMLPRSSSPHIALRGSYPGAKVIRHPQWRTNFSSEYQVGKIVKYRQTVEDKVNVQTAIELSSLTLLEKVKFTKIIYTYPGRGGRVYDGHLPLLGDLELVDVGDKVLVSATPAELDKLHERRGLWKLGMANTFRKKGFVNRRTHTGDFIVTFHNGQETFIMNPAALRKIPHLCLGQFVCISDDIEMVKRLQFGHGGWARTMKKVIGKAAKVVMIDGLDVYVRTKDYSRFIFNAANLTPTIYHALDAEGKNLAEAYIKFTRITKQEVNNMATAIEGGNIVAVGRFAKKHPECVLHCDPDRGISLLSYAAAIGSKDMVKTMVENGAFIESHGDGGCTPLGNATLRNRPSNVKYLLEHGADVNSTNNQGFTPLSIACIKGFSENAFNLLQHGADINHRANIVEGCPTPVMLSINFRAPSMVDLVLNRKDADLKAVSDSGLSLMHYAALQNAKYAMKQLIDRFPRLVDARNEEGRTPIFYAVEDGYVEITELLIEKGKCNVNAQENTMGTSPLIEAIAGKHFNLMEILLKNGADINLKNHAGNTAFQVALNVYIDSPDIKEEPFLIEMKNKWSHQGIKTNGDALLAFLVSYGADLNARNCANITQRQVVLDANPSILPVLTQIQAQTRRDIARQHSTVHRPLRTITKVTSTMETEVNNPSSFMDPFMDETGLRKPMAGDFSIPGRLPSGRRRRGPRKRFRNVQHSTTRDGPGYKSKETISKNDELNQLRDELLEKDEEMDFLLSRMKTLEHLVKKRISFTCGHDVTRSIADLFPNCPFCREPITSVIDIE